MCATCRRYSHQHDQGVIKTMLYTLSLVVDYTVLLLTLWLGLYLVTRSPHRAEAWLAALTSWSISGLILNMVYALVPPAVSNAGSSFEVLLFFWSVQALEKSPSAWLQGWAATPAVVFWFHATMLMRPGKMNAGQRALVVIAYLVALAGILLQRLQPAVYTPVEGDPLFINALHNSPLYAVFLVTLIVFCSLSIFNLAVTARAEPRYMPNRQFIFLVAATAVAALTAPLGLLAAWFDIPIPMALIAFLIGLAVAVTGFGVARYNALVENRVFAWDFYYTGAAVSAAALFSLGATWVMGQFYLFPPFLYVNVGCLAVIAAVCVDGVRKAVDFRYLRQGNRGLRERLRSSSQSSEDMLQVLAGSLEAICKPVLASYALLFLRSGNTCELVTAYRWDQPGLILPLGSLAADDVRVLSPGNPGGNSAAHLPEPLTKAALLIPIYTGDTQVGALVLGPAEHGAAYSPEERERLLDCNDFLAGRLDYLLLHRRLAMTAAEVSLPQPDDPPDPVNVQAVDQCLRSIHEYDRLSETPLARLQLVTRRLGPNATHIQVGEAVHDVLIEVLEKLHPEEDKTRPAKHGAVSREWYPYLILTQAYVDCLPNREIMTRLYISEGTFNRTRRSAIHSLTRLLIKLEGEAV